MTYFYLYRADLLKGWPRVWKMTGTAIEKRTREQKRAFVEYVADYLPERLIIDSDGVVRIPTEQEKYDLDPASYRAPDGMYVHEGLVREIPEQPIDMLVPVFDVATNAWVETATSEQVQTRSRDLHQLAYLNALRCYEYACTEHKLGLISSEELDSVATYAKALAANEGEVIKPDILNRYASQGGVR